MVSLFMIAAFGLLTCYAGYRAWSTYRWPTLLGGFAVLGLIASVSVEGIHRWQEHTYSAVASDLAGREAKVHCQRLSAAMFDILGPEGFVPYDAGGRAGQDIYLTWEVCKDLAAYKVGRRDLDRDRVIAVHILTHEAMHVSGDTNEASTECKAIQRNTTTARALGADPTAADALAQTYYATIYPNIEASYFSTECKPGGEMDQRLPTAPWPTTDPTEGILDLDLNLQEIP